MKNWVVNLSTTMISSTLLLNSGFIMNFVTNYFLLLFLINAVRGLNTPNKHLLQLDQVIETGSPCITATEHHHMMVVHSGSSSIFLLIVWNSQAPRRANIFQEPFVILPDDLWKSFGATN